MTAMDITVHASFLPHDPDASMASYRDTLGFEVRRLDPPGHRIQEPAEPSGDHRPD
jgi:hypothetical protein